MSRTSLSLHPVVKERIATALHDLSHVTAGLDVMADTLSNEDHDRALSSGVSIAYVGLTLRLLYNQLMDVWDRLDDVNLTEDSRRLYVRTDKAVEVTIDSAA